MHKMEDVRELVEQGRILYSTDKYEEALTYFLRAVEVDPYYEEAYEQLGICYIMMDRYDDAREAFNKWLMISDNNGSVYFHLGNLALLQGKSDESKAMYSKAEILGFNDPVMFLNLAMFYEEAGDYDGAIAQYDKLLRRNPYSYDFMEKKTQFLIRVGRYAQAYNSSMKMIQTDIDRFEGHHYLYVSLIMQGKYEKAEEHINELEARFPDNKTVIFDKIRLMDLLGRNNEALELMNKEFPNAQESEQLALLKLGLLLRMGKSDEAISMVESSEKLKNDEDVLTLMFSLYFAKGDYEKAKSYCLKIMENENSIQYEPAKYFLALSEDKMGNKDKAREMYRNNIEDYKAVLRNNHSRVDMYMYRCLCEYQLNDYEQARSDIEFLLAVSPDNAEFYLTAAVIYRALNMTDEETECLNKARSLDPNAVTPLI